MHCTRHHVSYISFGNVKGNQVRILGDPVTVIGSADLKAIGVNNDSEKEVRAMNLSQETCRF